MWVKDLYQSIASAYKKKVEKIHNYLDDELAYLNSFKSYTEQRFRVSLDMDYEAFPLSTDICSLSSMPEPAIEEIIRISKKVNDHTWGVILESSQVADLNVYIAQMNKVQINNRNANFLVATDSHEILLKLQNVFNWMNRVSYIVPNIYNRNIDNSFRPSITFHSLKHLEKYVSTPQSAYKEMLQTIGGKHVVVPNPNRVYCFNCKPLAPK